MNTEKKYKLLNYSTSSVNIPTPKGDKIMNGANGNKPFIDIFTFEEIEFAFHRSNAITSGLVEPLDEDKDSIYGALNIYDWKNKILFYRDIEDIIQNPTIENIEKVISIDDLQVIERVRGRVVFYMNEGRGLDTRLVNTVNRRFQEINSGVRKSALEVKPLAASAPVSREEFNAVTELNSTLLQEIEEMKKLLSDKLSAPKGEEPSSDTDKLKDHSKVKESSKSKEKNVKPTQE